MIDDSLLPQIINVKRTSTTVSDNYGEIDDVGDALVYENVRARITRNNLKKRSGDQGTLVESGYNPGSFYVIFINLLNDDYSNLELKAGDQIVVDDGRTLIVDYVSKSPGGVKDDHQQVYCSTAGNVE